MSLSPVPSPTNKSVSAADLALPQESTEVLAGSTSAETFLSTVPAAEQAAADYVQQAEGASSLKDKEVIQLPSTEADVMEFVRGALELNSEKPDSVEVQSKELPVEASVQEPTSQAASLRVEPSEETNKSEAQQVESSIKESAAQSNTADVEESDEETEIEETDAIAPTTTKEEALRLSADESIVDFMLDENNEEVFPGSKEFIATLTNLQPAEKTQKIQEWVANLDLDGWVIAIHKAIQSGKTDLLWDIVHSGSFKNKADQEETFDVTLALLTVQGEENLEMFQELVTWDTFKAPSIETLDHLVANTFSPQNVITEDRDEIFKLIMNLPKIQEVSGESIQKPIMEAAAQRYFDVVEALWKLPHSADKLSSEDLVGLSALTKKEGFSSLSRRIDCVKNTRWASNHALKISAAAVGILAMAVGAYTYSSNR